MAENVQETKPPEPPPKPPEVPRPTEQSNRSETQHQPQESQQSAQQDARNAAQSEYAQATNAREPDGMRPTPEFQAGLDQHTAAKAERNGAGQQDTSKVQQDADRDGRQADPATTAGDRQSTSPPGEQPSPSNERASSSGEQASEHAAARESAAAEHAKASNPQVEPTETPRSQTAPQDAARSEDAVRSKDQLQDAARPQDSVRPAPPQEEAQAVNPEPATSSLAAEATAKQDNDQDIRRQPVDDQVPAVEQGQQLDQEALPQAEAVQSSAVKENAARQPADEQGPTVYKDGQSPAAAEPNEAIDRDAQAPTAGDEEQGVGRERTQPTSATNSESSPVETPDGSDPNESGNNPSTAPPGGYTGPERRQYDAQHLDPVGDPQSGPEILIQDDNAQSEANALRETGTDVGERAGLGAGSGPWFDEGTNHREGGAVQQMTDGSCVSASGEMLTDGRVTQPELLSEIGDWSNLSALRDELNNRDGDGAWKGQYFATGAEAVERASEGPMAAQVQAPLGRGHMVMLEPGENGAFTVRDPYEGSSYDVDSNWVERYVAGGVFR